MSRDYAMPQHANLKSTYIYKILTTWNGKRINLKIFSIPLQMAAFGKKREKGITHREG
jgi:hypothetical protein